MKHPAFAAIFAAMTLVATSSSAQQFFDQREDASCTHGVSRRPGPPMPFRGRPPEFAIATQLNALELIIGITADQQPVWRSYTTALLNFIEPTNENSTRPPPSVSVGTLPPFPVEELADLAISRAEAAKALKAAISALQNTLHPEQLQKLAQVALPPPPPPPALDHRTFAGQRDQLGLMPPPREGPEPAFEGSSTLECPDFRDPG